MYDVDMTEIANEVGRDDIQAALWMWSGWAADQRRVDELLKLIDQYAGAPPTMSISEASDEAARIISAAHAEARRLTLVLVESAREAAERPSVPLPTGPASLCPGCRGAVAEAASKRARPRPMAVPEDQRTCSACGVRQGIEYFNRDVKSRNGRKAQCKECEADQRKERRARKKATTRGK